jgi:hypothetical protein
VVRKRQLAERESQSPQLQALVKHKGNLAELSEPLSQQLPALVMRKRPLFALVVCKTDFAEERLAPEVQKRRLPGVALRTEEQERMSRKLPSQMEQK